MPDRFDDPAYCVRALPTARPGGLAHGRMVETLAGFIIGEGDSARLPLLEAKGKILTLKPSDPVSKARDAAAEKRGFKGASAKAHKTAHADFEKMQKVVRRDLKQAFLLYQSDRSRRDFDSLRAMAADRLLKAHRQAFEAGLRAGGLSRQDAKWDANRTTKLRFDALTGEEMGHFLKFLSQLESDKARGVPTARVDNYVKSLAATFDQARIMATPSAALLDWNLESDDPCPDCRLIRKHSPFPREFLPTVPKGCLTRCRSNCYCIVSSRIVTPAEVEKVRRKHISREELIRRIERQQKKGKR